MINPKNCDENNYKKEFDKSSTNIQLSNNETTEPLKRKVDKMDISPTNDEEVEDRIKHSRERNRISAKKSRQRKKFYIESLAKKNAELEEENRNLRSLLYQQKQLYDQFNNINNIFNPSTALQYNGMNQFMLNSSNNVNSNTISSSNDNNGSINEITQLSVMNDYINQLNQVIQPQPQPQPQPQQQQQPEPPPSLQQQEQQLLSLMPSTSISTSSSSSSISPSIQMQKDKIQQQQQQQVLPIPVPSLHKTETPSSTIQRLTMYKSTVITPDIMQNKIQTPRITTSTLTTAVGESTSTTPTLIQQILPSPIKKNQQLQLFSHNVFSELDNKFIHEIKLTSLAFVVLDCSDTTSPIIYSSQKLLEITGYKENELYMQHITLFHSNDTDIQVATVVVNSLKYRREMCVCYKNYTKSKTSFWNHLYLVPITNMNNDIINFVGIYNVVDDDVGVALCDIQSIGLKDLASSTEYILPTRIIDQMKASHPGYQMRKKILGEL